MGFYLKKGKRFFHVVRPTTQTTSTSSTITMKRITLCLLVVTVLYKYAHSYQYGGPGCTDKYSGVTYKVGDKWKTSRPKSCFRCECSQSKTSVRMCDVVSPKDTRQEIHIQKLDESELAVLTQGLDCEGFLLKDKEEKIWRRERGKSIRVIHVYLLGALSYHCAGGFEPVFLNNECYVRYNRTSCAFDLYNTTTNGKCFESRVTDHTERIRLG